MKALLLLALQVDLLPGGGAEVPGSETLAANLRPLLTAYDCVAAANYWLPVEHRMFAANHPWRKVGQPVEVGGTPTVLHNFFCIQESFGAELVPGLDPGHLDFTAHLGTQPDLLPSSAFSDDGRRHDTGLSRFLWEKNVEEIHLAGQPLETLVHRTALDGLALGFRVGLVDGGWRGSAPADIQRTLAALQKAGVDFAPRP